MHQRVKFVGHPPFPDASLMKLQAYPLQSRHHRKTDVWLDLSEPVPDPRARSTSPELAQLQQQCSDVSHLQTF